jgi:hypothetical protein
MHRPKLVESAGKRMRESAQLPTIQPDAGCRRAP